MNILEEFYKLKNHLQPLLSDRHNKTLIEIERILIREVEPSNRDKKKKITAKRPTKQELYNRFFYKNI